MKLLLLSTPASDDEPPPSPSLDMQSPLSWSDCAIPSPNFRISTYSALAGALVEKPTMTHAVQEHAVDGHHERCEPPELAMYTVGVFDNDAVTPVDDAGHVERIDGWTEYPAEGFWPEPPSHMSPRHDLGYGLELYYDYTSDRDPEGSSIHTEHSWVPTTMPAASPEDSVRLYRITETGQLRYASLSPPSPCSSEQSLGSADADLMVDERASVSIKSESDASSLYSPPQSPLSPLEEQFSEYGRKSPGPPRKRLRPTTLLACYYCRKRKIRCGGPDPTDEFKRCKQCIHRERECEFPEKSNRGRRPKALPLPAPMNVDNQYQYPHV